MPQDGRADVQSSVREAEAALSDQGQLSGKIGPGHVRSIVDQASALQAAHRETGERRLGRERERVE